jgi:dihydrofolate reductase
MNKPKISLFVALSDNMVIGVKGKLPWYIPDDFKRMKEVTSGHAIIMGRKTYESIGRVLPNRVNIIISRDPEYKVEGGIVCSSLVTALEEANNEEIKLSSSSEVRSSRSARTIESEIFIFGGGQIFEQAISLADKLYLTVVHKEIEGDTYFPNYSAFTKKVYEQSGTSNGFPYTFLELEK